MSLFPPETELARPSLASPLASSRVLGALTLMPRTDSGLTKRAVYIHGLPEPTGTGDRRPHQQMAESLKRP